MPTYDYECSACDHHWEEFQSIKAAPLKKCPACGKSKAKRQIGTGAGVIFKGSGFYTTDYRSESYKQGVSSETPKPSTPAKSENSSSASSDSATTSSDSK